MGLKRKILVGVFALTAVLTAVGGGRTGTAAAEPFIEMVNIKGMPFRQFAALLSRGTSKKIVVSSEAGDIPVYLYLENVDVEAALESACRAYQCWFKVDTDTGIMCVVTLEEYKQGMSMHDDELVRAVKLRHIDARTVGDSLHNLFLDRVIWERPDEDEDDGVEDLEQALERMDTLADRAQFSQDMNNSGSGSGGNRNNNRSSRNGRSGRGNRSSSSSSGSRGGSANLMTDAELDVAEEVILGQLAGERGTDGGKVRRPGVVFLSVLRSTNTLLIRTADSKAMESITALLEKLDTPRPQVLLEVKVLEIQLDNERRHGIDWLFQNHDLSGGRSTGLQSETFGDGYGQVLPPNSDFIPQGTGLQPRATILQVVSDHVVARLQMLEEQGDITRLATPNLCVADGEVSRIFIGTQTSILTDVNVNTFTYAGNTTTSEESTDPDAERRDVGTTLLITPKIHSDTSVTIRVVHEDSQLGAFKDIEYGVQESFRSQDVITRSVVSTIVARDGAISAVGGLIREETGSSDSGVPVLMNVPFLGDLFKAHRKNKNRSELLVLLRPYILCGPGNIEQVTMNMVERLSAHPSARDDIPALGVYDNGTGTTDAHPGLEALQESAQPREIEEP